MSREAIEDRRQRALEAFHDDMESRSGHGITDAIETATRVKITDRVIEEAYPWILPSAYELARPRLSAALAELGFEVEE